MVIFNKRLFKKSFTAKAQGFFAKCAKNKCLKIIALRSLRKLFATFAFNVFLLFEQPPKEAGIFLCANIENFFEKQRVITK